MSKIGALPPRTSNEPSSRCFIIFSIEEVSPSIEEKFDQPHTIVRMSKNLFHLLNLWMLFHCNSWDVGLCRPIKKTTPNCFKFSEDHCTFITSTKQLMRLSNVRQTSNSFEKRDIYSLDYTVSVVRPITPPIIRIFLKKHGIVKRVIRLLVDCSQCTIAMLTYSRMYMQVRGCVINQLGAITNLDLGLPEIKSKHIILAYSLRHHKQTDYQRKQRDHFIREI